MNIRLCEVTAMDEHKRKKIACNNVDALVRQAEKAKRHVFVKETGLPAYISFCSGLVKSQCPGCLDMKENAYYFPPHLCPSLHCVLKRMGGLSVAWSLDWMDARPDVQTYVRCCDISANTSDA